MRARLLVALAIVIVLALAAWSCRRGAGDAPAPAGTLDPGAVDASSAPPARERLRVKPTAPRLPPELEPATAPEPAIETPRVTIYADGVIPEEERGTGSAVVHLSLVDALTEQPVESWVRLWRLGVPADDLWPEGDHVQSDFRIQGSILAENLPPGRYRLEVAASVTGTDDPPEFDVFEGHANAFIARVTLPDERAMRLRVFDEHGVELTHAARRDNGDGSGSSHPAQAPAWARPRATRDPTSGAFFGRRGGRRDFSSGRRFRPVEARDGAFDLGTIRRSARNTTWSRWREFRFDDRTEVFVDVRSQDAVEGDCYVAVAVPALPLKRAVWLPDGRRAMDAGAEFEIQCRARFARPDADSSWRTIPVHVEVSLDGYERLEFDWCAADGEPAMQTMLVTEQKTE